jgi:outer membrane cobalamin receptor
MNNILRSFILLFCCCSISAYAFPADSTQAKKDSVVRIVPIPEIGSVEPFRDSAAGISERTIIFREYRSLYDIIAREPGVFVRDLASAGQQNQLMINGVDGKNIAVMVDGVPYNDYYTGSYDLWLIPVDAIERVELFTGAEAIFYDGKSGGGAINIVTKNFNNNRAKTRLRYTQGVSGYSQTDAMFAQNIMTGMNLSFGLAHYGFGSNRSGLNYRARFNNSNTDSWMFRSKLRYDVTNGPVRRCGLF